VHYQARTCALITCPPPPTPLSRDSLAANIKKAQDVLKEKPDWPPVKALIRFHLPLRRLQSHYSVSKKWAPHYFALRDGCLYYSNGKLGHADSQEGTMAYMSGNPPPDGRHCIDLSSAVTFCLPLPVLPTARLAAVGLTPVLHLHA
jgi:hypothetical protein